MIAKIKEKLKNSSNFKFRFIILACALFSFSFYSVGYAYFSAVLLTSGEINIMLSSEEVQISSISSAVITKDGVENSSPSYTGCEATFDIQLVKTNSTVTYSVTIVNNSDNKVKYNDLEITNSNEAITYVMSGIDSSTVLEPGESVTLTIKFLYTEEYQYSYPSDKNATMAFAFNFNYTTSEEYISLYGYINEDTGDVTATEYGAPITMVVYNDNAFSMKFTVTAMNNFLVYSDTYVLNQEYTVQANDSLTLSLYIDDSDTSTAIGTSAVISVMVNTTYVNVSKSSLIDTVTLTLENKGKYEILEDGYTETDEEVDYSSSNSSGGGIYSEVGNDGGKVYYYRGIVNNNYFSFAGYTWRILRIDENSNVRLIMNTLLENSSGTVITEQFKTTHTASSLSAAQTLVKLIVDPSSTNDNSPIYGYINDTSTTTLRGWYNNTIAGTDYEQYMVDSVFCQDTTGGNAISSGTESTVFYFAPYQKVGQDTALYDPAFSCPTDEQITEKIGLLTVDEYVFAGGAYKVSNTSFFLNDSGISNSWWTMSPAYYDESQSKVGVFYVASDGSTSDWPNTNTIINSYGVRPVITVNGNYEITGDGTESNPYTFK